MGKKVACLALSKTYNPVEIKLFVYHLSQYISNPSIFKKHPVKLGFRVEEPTTSPCDTAPEKSAQYTTCSVVYSCRLKYYLSCLFGYLKSFAVAAFIVSHP